MRYLTFYRPGLSCLLLALWCVLGWPWLPAHAAVQTSVSGSVRRDYARVSFGLPKPVNFRASASGNTVTITFDEAVKPDLSKLPAALKPYVRSARLSGDRAIVLETDKAYRTRTFLSGTGGGVDLLGIAPGAKPPAASPVAPPVPQTKAAAVPAPAPAPAKPAIPAIPAAAIPVIKPVAARQQEEKPQAKPAEKKLVTPLPVLRPAAPEAEKPVPPVAEQKPQPAEEKPAPEVKPEIAASAPEEMAAPAAAPASSPAPATEKPPLASQTISFGKGMLVQVNKRQNGVELFFPWKERVGAAVFMNGQYLWIVFNGVTPVNTTALKSVLPPYVTSLEALDVPGHTVLRIGVDTVLFPTVQRRSTGYEWMISLARRSRPPAEPILAKPVINPPLPPHIELNVLEVADPVEITDPATGRYMTIMPVYKGNTGVFPERRFVDCVLPRTAQGVVMTDYPSSVRLAKLRTGVRVSGQGGLHLSPDLPEVDMEAAMAAEGGAHTLFPYEQWKVVDYPAFLAKKQQLQTDIVRASNDKANFLRASLAKLYMGEGLFMEALGVLNLIAADDAFFFEDYQLAALRGASNFMMGRYSEAATDFTSPTLDEEAEIAFWRRVSQVMQGNERKLLKFLPFDKEFGKFYPPPIRQKLAILSADQSIGMGRLNSAARIIDQLAADEQIAPVQDQADYMTARIMDSLGKSDKAREKLEALIEKTRDRFVRVRAEYTLATMRYSAGEIDREQFTRVLERLRVAWRGDAFELNILNLLGGFYIADEKYIQGMRAFKEIVANFPNTAEAQEVAGIMAETFVKLFNEGKADVLTPLEALALYYEFRELTPIGKAGDKMIQNLADRLAGVDLLDRASALLSHQVKYRLEKEERSRVGARLALIELLNREPRQALEVLELTGYGDVPETLRRRRNHLAAQAYADIGDSETALTLLRDDYSADAKMLRLDIFWDNKDWDNVIITAEDILAGRRDITAPLTPVEAQTLLRLAVAYTFGGDTLQLQYLRDYFTPLLEGNPKKDSFLFITNDRGPVNPDNISMLSRDLGEIRSFLDSYRTRMQEGGLSNAIE